MNETSIKRINESVIKNSLKQKEHKFLQLFFICNMKKEKAKINSSSGHFESSCEIQKISQDARIRESAPYFAILPLKMENRQSPNPPKYP